MKNNNTRIILIGIIVLVFISMYTTMPKEAVADIEGKPCSTDADCPCLGNYTVGGTNIPATGIGVGECIDWACDMTYCIDVAPVGEWIKDNPFAWIKEHILLTIVLIGLIVLVAMWPKV